MARTSSKEKEKPTKTKAAAPASTPTAAAAPGAGAKLGTKQTCPKCATKFYDFCKEELVCPKCSAKLKASQLVHVPSVPRAEPKKPKNAEKVVTEALSQDDTAVEPGAAGADAFESVDDLGDDDTVVEEIDVDDDDQKSDY